MRDMIGEARAREFGRTLLTVGLAIASSVFVAVSQLGEMKAKVENLEKHAEHAHPPGDYRALQNHKDNAQDKRMDRIETKLDQMKR